MKRAYGLLVAGLVFLGGCETNRNYRTADLSSEHAYKKGKTSPQLKENEVLGLKAEGATEQDIQRILDETRAFNLKEYSTVLLVQSGASHPDREMIEQLSRPFTVIPYTGVPSELCSEGDSDTAKTLRLAAAHAKAETVVVYWGSVEMKRDDLPTGIVSWVPVVDFVVPDEYQKVRMHLKVALIDVRSGQWATFRTEPIEDQTLTTRYAREKAPDWPLKGIKDRVYRSTVQKLLSGYVVASN